MTDEQILRKEVNLTEDCILDTTEQEEVYEDCIARKHAISLHDEIGDSPTSNIDIDVTNVTPCTSNHSLLHRRKKK